MLTRAYRSSGAVICVWLAIGLSTPAQAAPWVEYADAASGSLCDVVNAANLELVVLETTGELVGITGTDVIFLDTFVDEEGFVFFQGLPAGFIEFAEDGDGFRTLWWFATLDDVANVNEFTGEPTLTGLLPTDFLDVPCDACPFWDEPAECLDSDLDGVEDLFDLCPLTLFGEIVYSDGCSCGQVDYDADGVDECDDLCPDTPLSELADFFGCSCSQLDDDQDGVDNCYDLCSGTPLWTAVDLDGCPIGGSGGIVINLCGAVGAMIMPMMLCTLGMLRFRPRGVLR